MTCGACHTKFDRNASMPGGVCGPWCHRTHTAQSCDGLDFESKLGALGDVVSVQVAAALRRRPPTTPSFGVAGAVDPPRVTGTMLP